MSLYGSTSFHTSDKVFFISFLAKLKQIWECDKHRKEHGQPSNWFLLQGYEVLPGKDCVWVLVLHCFMAR